jgi:hypothetical protein
MEYKINVGAIVQFVHETLCEKCMTIEGGVK